MADKYNQVRIPLMLTWGTRDHILLIPESPTQIQTQTLSGKSTPNSQILLVFHINFNYAIYAIKSLESLFPFLPFWKYRVKSHVLQEQTCSEEWFWKKSLLVQKTQIS